MWSCISDRNDDCPVPADLRLNFAFTNNKQRQDRLVEDIRDIRIYIFDQNSDLLTHIIDVTPEEVLACGINTDIPSGLYTFVAWASNSEDMMRDGFRAAYADDTDGDGITNEYDEIARDSTTLHDFRMMLAYDELPEGVKGDITPKVEDFGDLYYASASDIAIDRTQNQTVEFDFTLNTAVLNVRVNGLRYFESAATRADSTAMPLSVFVLGRNSIMEDNNAMDDNAQRMRYNPYDQTLGTDTLSTNIKSMRLAIDEKDNNDVMLYLQQPNADSDVVDPVDLIDLITSTCDQQGNTIYNTQKDLDIETEFTIDISVAEDLTVSVSVNGFEPVTLTSEASKPGETPNTPDE